MSASLPPPTSIQDLAVSVVIVNWNTRDMLRACIESIQAQTATRHEIIVVDNASTDGSAAMVRSTFPDVVLIENSQNLGFAGANNQGLAAAKGDYLLLLNPDTIVLDKAIDRMTNWLETRPDVGCAGCQVLEGPGVIQRTCFADPTPLNQFIVAFGLMRLGKYVPRLGRPWYTDWDRTTARDVDVVSGMFMLLPRRVFEAVGPLDDSFFVYAEEADWCRRIRHAGWRCVFTPIAQIVHLDGGSKSTAQIRSRMYVQMEKSHLIYARKHDGAIGYVFAKGVLIASSVLRLAVFGVKRVIRGDADTKARIRLSIASLRWHLTGQEPTS